VEINSDELDESTTSVDPMNELLIQRFEEGISNRDVATVRKFQDQAVCALA